MTLAAYAIRRALQVLPLLLFVVVVNFVLIHAAPGDPATILAGDGAPRDYVEELRKSYGLDQPLLTQFGVYIVHLIQGDFGQSFTYQLPVLQVVTDRLGATLLLVLASQVPAIVLGTLLGAFSARHYPSRIDSAVTAMSLTFYTIPVFFSGLVLILVFGVILRWLPVSGMTSISPPREPLAAAGDVLRHLALPATALGLYSIPQYVRVTRASVIDVMREDFITTARAIGYSEDLVFFKHALRNALLPTVTLAGLSLSFVFAGALLTETVFSWPGMGRLMYDAVYWRDYPTVMGVFVITSACVIVAAIATDVLYAFLDPRVSYE